MGLSLSEDFLAMPRQPFLPKHKGKHFCFDERGLAANSTAAALSGQIITEWARVEHSLAMVLAALLGEHPRAGVALFSQIRQARLQQNSLHAVADTVILDHKIRTLFDAVLSFTKSVGKERDAIAHGVFGWSFDIPHITLWVDSADLAIYDAEAWHRFTPGMETNPNHDELEKKIFCYENKDFAGLLASVADVKTTVFSLYGIIRHGKDATSQEYVQLSSQPRVAQVLANQNGS